MFVLAKHFFFFFIIIYRNTFRIVHKLIILRLVLFDILALSVCLSYRITSVFLFPTYSRPTHHKQISFYIYQPLFLCTIISSWSSKWWRSWHTLCYVIFPRSEFAPVSQEIEKKNIIDSKFIPVFIAPIRDIWHGNHFIGFEYISRSETIEMVFSISPSELIWVSQMDFFF